ncbi:MAG: Fe-S cluster assembly protein SufD [Coxiella sp. (in: Bacteria)]|nr:MAG: Fe-S cluster assembly protein SufD [Coxiella sp. (in: g-proteobacteria)]
MGGLMQHKLAATWQEEGLRALAAQLPFTGATQHWQDKALSFFIEDGFPTRKTEVWRYTDLTDLLQQDFVLNKYQGALDLSPFEIAESNRLVIVNGHVNFDLSTCDDDLSILPLDILLETADETLLRELKLDLDSQYFAGLNSALLNQGAYIKIKPNQCVQKPLHILHVHHDNGPPPMQNLRFYIDVDKNAEVQIIEEHVGLSDAVYMNNIVTQINLNFDARLRYYKLQRDSARAYHMATTVISLSAESQLHYNVFTTGACLSREDLHVRHYERGAEAHLLGLFQANDKQQMAHHTRVDHFKGGCTTHQHYKGIVDDRAHAAFDGQIIIHPGAQKSSTHQTNHNLLLSDQAEIDTKPSLEIYVDDVTASHGATVGELSDKALFYLRSRGISEDDARALLIAAFADAIFDELPRNKITDYIKEASFGGTSDD